MTDSESEYEYANLSESGSEDSDIYSSDSEDSSDEDIAVDWKQISDSQPNPPPPRFQFVATPGTTFLFEDNFDVLEYFKLFFDDSLLDIIVLETNRYAEQHPGRSTSQWKNVDKNEMMIFLAICILQGLIKKPEERMYWSSNEMWSTPIFPKLMNLRRYISIKRNLHFSNNETFDRNTHPNPKLCKIWPIYEIINNKCSSLYIPERDITIDESLMLYKGRLGWVQYIPLKRARFGIKLYLLCESKSGYLFSFIIYTGKGTIIDEKYKDMPVTSQIVVSLLEPLMNQGYCLTTDNYYTSPQLADFLVNHKTDTYGTVRKNRKDIPKFIQTKKLKKGEIVAAQRGKVMVMKWQDKRDICLLSTVHNTEKGTTNKTDKDGNVIFKPKLVIDYNETMGGVDRLDQHLHDYPIIRKRGKKYYKKIFFHLLDISIWNAFVLYKKNGGEKSNLDFRSKLVERLIQNYHSEINIKKSGRPKSSGILRLTERHFPSFVPPTPKKEAPTRYCAVCCSKRDNKGKRKRKESRYMCNTCNVGLCAAPCFEIYHTKENFE